MTSARDLIDSVVNGADPVDALFEKQYTAGALAEMLHDAGQKVQDAVAALHEVLIASAKYTDEVKQIVAGLTKYPPALFQLADRYAAAQNVFGADVVEMASVTQTGTLQLTKLDKKVVDAFTDKRSAKSKDLESDGQRLEWHGTIIAYWIRFGSDKQEKVFIRPTGGKASQTITNLVRKLTPRKLFGGYEK